MRTQRTDARLLLESDDPVELPPAEVDESAVVLQFENLREYVPELLETLRAGTTAELVPVMLDGSTFAVHTRTRTFWVKLWHSSEGMARVERVQVLSCLPSTRGVRVLVADEEDFDDDFDDDEDFDDGPADDTDDDTNDDTDDGADDDEHDGPDDEGDAAGDDAADGAREGDEGEGDDGAGGGRRP